MDVRGIDHLSEPGGSSKPEKPVSRKEENRRGEKTSGDALTISNEAETAFQERVYSKMVKDLPDIREDEVERARSALDRDELLSQKNLEQVAEKLMRGLGDDRA
jgi:hypothetical protein